MATKPMQLTVVYPGVISVSWIGLAQGDDGQPLEMPDLADKSVQITGNFGGGTLVLEGTNDPDGVSPSYNTLNNPQGTDLSFTAASIEAVLENVFALRPRVVGGSGSTDLDVRMLLRTSLAGRS